MQGVVVYRGQVEVDRDLFVLWRLVQQLVKDALLDMSEVLCRSYEYFYQSETGGVVQHTYPILVCISLCFVHEHFKIDSWILLICSNRKVEQFSYRPGVRVLTHTADTNIS